MHTLAIIDTETTGLDATKDHLLEVAIGIYSAHDRALVEARSWLVMGAPAEAVEASMHVHGIGTALLALGRPWPSVQTAIEAILRHAQAFMAHNAVFDSAWLPETIRDSRPWICSMDDVEWPKGGGSKSLTSLAIAHGVGVVRAHRALDDVLTLADLLTRAGEMTDLDALLARAMRPRAVYMLADTSFSAERNALAKEQGFRFDAASKTWRRRMATEDTAGLPFAVKAVA